jgi:hypothetical protein
VQYSISTKVTGQSLQGISKSYLYDNNNKNGIFVLRAKDGPQILKPFAPRKLAANGPYLRGLGEQRRAQSGRSGASACERNEARAPQDRKGRSADRVFGDGFFAFQLPVRQATLAWRPSLLNLPTFL